MNPIEIGQENFQIDFNIWVTDIKLSKGQLHTKFDIVDFDKSTHQSITLTQAYLNKVGNYDKKISATIKDNIISFFVDDATSQQHFSFYQVVGVFDVDGVIAHLPITAMNPRFHRKYFKRRKFFFNSDKSRVVFPTLGYYNFVNFFIDDRSDYDSKRHCWLEYLTTVAFQKRLLKQSKDTILMFEKDLEYAQDNSFSLFQWVQNNISQNNYYYVMQRGARQLERLKHYQKHIVYAGSLKYYWLLVRAKLLVSSETPNNLYTSHNRKYAGPLVKKVLFKKTNFMLQHGVIAMKKLGTQVDPVLNANSKIIDYFNASTQDEQKLIHEYLNFELSQIPVLGLTRWDRFKYYDKTDKKTFLYMPTWRRGLFNMTPDEFIQSDYYKGISKLVSSSELEQYLQENESILYVYLHPFMQRFSEKLVAKSENVKILNSQIDDLPIYIQSAHILITDYSSVAWDFAFQRKKILFYQFDRKAYLDETGSYIDLENNPLGSSYETTGAIVEALKSDIQLPNYNDLLGKQSFNHCEQTYHYIMDLLAK